MSNDLDQAPQATEPAQTDAVVADVAAEADVAQAEPDVAATAEADAAKAAEDARNASQKRIDRLTREKWDARRQTAALEARLQELDHQRAATRDPTTPLSADDLDRMVLQRAEVLRTRDEFNARCNDVYDKGAKAFPDFQTALAQFSSVGGLPQSLVEAALDTSAPHQILHYLAQNLDEAETIFGLSPARQGAAVTRLEAKIVAAPSAQVSKAPAPVRPISVASTVSDAEPKDADAWAAQFLKNRAARRS